MTKFTLIERCKKESLFDDVEIWVCECDGEYRIAFIEDEEYYRAHDVNDYYHSISREMYEAMLRVVRLRELADEEK